MARTAARTQMWMRALRVATVEGLARAAAASMPGSHLQLLAAVEGSAAAAAAPPAPALPVGGMGYRTLHSSSAQTVSLLLGSSAAQWLGASRKGARGEALEGSAAATCRLEGRK